MAKGIIYRMTTIVPGLIKIGKTGTDNFESRMYHLEHNGYSNVVGLKRYFAIEVDEYDDKERLIDDIFSKSRVGSTELFSLDINLVVQLLSSFEGKQIYPEDKSKEVVFDEATDKRGFECIPDGDYYFNYTPKVGSPCKAILRKQFDKLILCKGSTINTEKDDLRVKGWQSVRTSSAIQNGVVVEDIPCDSLSMAAALVKGQQTNGWDNWKTKSGKSVDIFRTHEKED